MHFEYKGYTTFAQYQASEDDTTGYYHGKVENINDLVSFEGGNLKEFEEEFKKAIDDYIEVLKYVGR